MLSEKNIVEKSKALVWAQLQDYGIGELKILDTYLSRINARDPNSSLVTFTKKEYATLMGIDPNIRTNQLKTYTKKLLSNVVTIELPDEGYVQYPLFSKAECRYDQKQNQVLITVRCNEELKPVFFDISRDGYVKYQLKNVINLRSQYSIRLYTILKANPFGWTAKVEELRERLGAASATYDEFKRFNNMVLKKAVDEINQITDIDVTAENIKRGRTVVAVKFSVQQKKQVVLNPGDLPASENEEMGEEPEQFFLDGFDPSIPDPDDTLGLAISALPPDLTREQVELLRTLAVPHVPNDVQPGIDAELWIHDYLQKKTALMRAAGAKHPFGWLRRAVEEDW